MYFCMHVCVYVNSRSILSLFRQCRVLIRSSIQLHVPISQSTVGHAVIITHTLKHSNTSMPLALHCYLLVSCVLAKVSCKLLTSTSATRRVRAKWTAHIPTKYVRDMLAQSHNTHIHILFVKIPATRTYTHLCAHAHTHMKCKEGNPALPWSIVLVIRCEAEIKSTQKSFK